MPEKKAFIIAFILVSAAFLAGGERVAVVADYPQTETYTYCVPFLEEADGYEILEAAGLDMDWAYYPAFGHALCGIDSIGCPSSNCFCSATDYWNFYTSVDGRLWSYSQVGFDGGSSCSEHLCAEDETFIGLAYGSYGTEPVQYSWTEVCCPVPGDQSPCGEITVTEVLGHITAWEEERAVLEEIVDLIIAWSQG